MSKYKKISYIIIGYFYFQEISRIVFNVHLSSVVTFLPLAIMDDVQEYNSLISESVRSSSLFKEPAVFAQFLLPLLCYELFGKEKINVKYVCFLCITLLWSRAGNAMVGLIALGLCYITALLKNRVSGKKITSFLFASLVLLVSLSVFLNTEDGRKVMERADTIDAESTVDKGFLSSTFFRIYQGYFVFNEYSTYYKILGNDNGNYILKSAYNSSVIRSLYSNREFIVYFNSFQTVLIYTGFIGLIIMFFFFKIIWENNSYVGKSMLFLLISISLVSCNFFTTTMALYLIPAIALKVKSESGRII